MKLANEIADAKLAEEHPKLDYELEEGEIYEPPKPLPAYTGPLLYSTADRSEQSVGAKTVTPRRHTWIRKNHRKRTQEELAKKYEITLSKQLKEEEINV